MSFPRFYPIFDSADWIARALPLGVKLVQIRIKDVDGDQLVQELTRARDLCHAHGATLVVNDHWQTAIELGCDFIHLGQEDLDVADIPAIRRAGMRLGLSTHDHAELDRALALAPDYIALGPVWPTILKKMKWEQQGLERVSEWRKLVGDTPLVAIGGVTPERATLAYAAGADIASAVTDITLNPDPEGRIREWLRVAA
ncbi:thiamine phosphate synthase [Paracoccus sp. PAR01]|uniref:thiamine phosphate synthase n=1 Tax=Paracoccus sp. PAR01 TaxID=2769282 RepID=UPI0017809082|nr:thiamine phosphate synthase [Paracoccus sp. PAR01]MBD9528028.1 thiamine phosphate synthase [Paracoccus sp. PAR01]